MMPLVVVADDDWEMQDLVATDLENMGLRVVRTDNGADLLNLVANAGPFDLIITDIAMPWMNGLQVTRSVRSAGMTTPVILITAFARDEFRQQARELGEGTILLHKPFNQTQLEGAVYAMLPQLVRYQN